MARTISLGKETKVTITLATAASLAVAGWFARDYIKPPASENREVVAASEDPSRRELVNWMIDVSGKLGSMNARIESLEESNRDLRNEIRSLSFRNRHNNYENRKDKNK